MKTKLNVKGMHCKACDMLIEDVLKDLNANVIKSSHKTGIINLEFNESQVSLDQIKKAINEEGYEVLQ